jgi:hypothetical protein
MQLVFFFKEIAVGPTYKGLSQQGCFPEVTGGSGRRIKWIMLNYHVLIFNLKSGSFFFFKHLFDWFYGTEVLLKSSVLFAGLLFLNLFCLLRLVYDKLLILCLPVISVSPPIPVIILYNKQRHFTVLSTLDPFSSWVVFSSPHAVSPHHQHSQSLHATVWQCLRVRLLIQYNHSFMGPKQSPLQKVLTVVWFSLQLVLQIP